MGKDRSDNKSASAIQAAPIAQHRKKLGDREKFEQFERKEPRRAQQLKAAARRERKAAKNAGGDDDFSVLTLVFVCVSFGLFTLAAGYLVLKNLLPSRPQ